MRKGSEVFVSMMAEDDLRTCLTNDYDIDESRKHDFEQGIWIRWRWYKTFSIMLFPRLNIAG